MRPSILGDWPHLKQLCSGIWRRDWSGPYNIRWSACVTVDISEWTTASSSRSRCEIRAPCQVWLSGGCWPRLEIKQLRRRVIGGSLGSSATISTRRSTSTTLARAQEVTMLIWSNFGLDPDRAKVLNSSKVIFLVQIMSCFRFPFYYVWEDQMVTLVVANQHMATELLICHTLLFF